jgi:hypothetical protein
MTASLCIAGRIWGKEETPWENRLEQHGAAYLKGRGHHAFGRFEPSTCTSVTYLSVHFILLSSRGSPKRRQSPGLHPNRFTVRAALTDSSSDQVPYGTRKGNLLEPNQAQLYTPYTVN